MCPFSYPAIHNFRLYLLFLQWSPLTSLLQGASNQKEISHGRVSWQTRWWRVYLRNSNCKKIVLDGSQRTGSKDQYKPKPARNDHLLTVSTASRITPKTSFGRANMGT